MLYTRRAQTSLMRLRAWMAREAFAEADDYIRRLLSFCDRLAQIPHSGSVREDGSRRIGYKRKTTVAFVVDDERRQVVIVDIAHRGRRIRGRP